MTERERLGWPTMLVILGCVGVFVLTVVGLRPPKAPPVTRFVVAGRVVHTYQVATSFWAQSQVSGPHAVVDGASRWDVAGRVGSLVVGDSVVARVQLVRPCPGCEMNAAWADTVEVVR